MGFNTVALILNDHMHNIMKAPHAFTFALTNPPMAEGKHREMWYQHVREVAGEHGELRFISPYNDIHVLPTFHADDAHFLYAGRNTIERLKVHKFRNAKLEDKTVRTVTLILPDWWRKE